MPRLFIALEPTPDFRDSLSVLQDNLREAGVSARYLEPSNLHLTLAFIGQWTEDVKALLPPVETPFPVTLSHLGTFDKASVLWAGVKPSRALNALAAKVRGILDEAGILFDHQPFTPHITLGRKPVIPESVRLPDSLQRIGNNAFYRCEALTSVSVPDGVTGIGAYTFCGCTGLRDVSLPDSVDFIGAEAFYECGALTAFTIPLFVREIGTYAFYHCDQLTEITVPACVKTIGKHAFGSGLTLRGRAGTEAERFAKEAGIPFISISVPAGDIDGNGIAEIADAVWLSRLLAEDSTVPAQIAENLLLETADLSGDGCLSVRDFSALLKLLEGQTVSPTDSK